MIAMQTYTGRMWDLFDPDPANVCWVDLAYPACAQVRFNGHTRPWSVASHSWWVSEYLRRAGEPAIVQLGGLLHDIAHESYLGDMIRPLKELLAEQLDGFGAYWEWLTIEHDRAVAHWALPARAPELFEAMHSPAVRRPDDLLLATEKHQFAAPSDPWPGLPEPWDVALRPIGYDELTGRFNELREACR